jgi:hypothetical protein
VAAEGQASVAERLATRAQDDLVDPDATDAQGLPAPITQGLAASVDDVAAPEGTMDGEAPPPATAIQATAIPRFFYCPQYLCPEILAKNPGGGGGGQEACPGSSLSHQVRSRQIHV